MDIVFFNKLGDIFLFLFSLIKAIWHGPWIYRGGVFKLIAPLSPVILACYGPNERYIIANFLEWYYYLIGDNKVHWGHSVWCDRAIRTMFYECLAVLKCGLHCGDLLIWSRAQMSRAIFWVVGLWRIVHELLAVSFFCFTLFWTYIFFDTLWQEKNVVTSDDYILCCLFQFKDEASSTNVFNQLLFPRCAITFPQENQFV